MLARHLKQQNPCRDRRIDRVAVTAHWDSHHEVRNIKHRARAGNPQTGCIFSARYGRSVSMNNVLNREILPTLKAAGIPWKGWHAFRRGLATNLHALGVDDLTIQRILRHSNVSVTQKCYIKTLPKQSVAGMRRLEAALDEVSRVQ